MPKAQTQTASHRRRTNRGRVPRAIAHHATRRCQPKIPGLVRDSAWAAVDPRIKARAQEEAIHLNVSASWLIATILADAFKINLDAPIRAYRDVLAPAQPRRA